MNEVPPIIAGTPTPPPLPAAARQPQPAVYARRCKVLCIVAGSLALAAVAAGGYGMAIGEKIDSHVLLFCGCYALLCYGAALLLHRRGGTAAYFTALPCLVILLPVIPFGTVFGILGLIWLHKAELLRHV